MLGTILTVVAVVVLVLVALGAVWFIGMRTKWRPVIDFQRRVNRRVFNPRQMRKAGSPGAYAGIVRHTGRRSGRPYETPVVPLPADDGFVIVLVYGDRTEWVRNVLAAGRATIVLEGETHEVVDPVVVSADESGREWTDAERKEMRRFGNRVCLRLTAVPVSGAGTSGG